MDTIVITLPYVSIPDSFFLKQKWRQFENEKSSGFYLKYKNTHIQYSRTYNCLTLMVSVTKFLYSANYIVLNSRDIEKFCFEINYILKEIFDSLYNKYKVAALTNIKDWNLNRIDIVANYVCENQHVMETTLNILKKLDYPYLKKKCYYTGIHDGNKSLSLNIYNKNAEISYRNKTNTNKDILKQNILRFEIQLKKNSIKYLVNKGLLPGKKLEDLLCNLNNLNHLFRYYLDKYNILRKFLSESELNLFLKKLLRKKKITENEYNNINSILIKQNKEVCANTRRKYIRILNKYNISHVFTESHLKNQIDFNNFELFKNDQLKSSFDHKIQILIYLYLISLATIKCTKKIQKKILIDLTRPIKSVKILDDS